MINPRFSDFAFRLMIRILTIATAIVWLVGCTQMLRIQKAQRLSPLHVSASKPIALSPPTIALERGALVGGHAINPNKSYHLSHRWEETFEIDANEFNFAMRDELKNHGYVFASGGHAPYQLKVTIQRLIYNLFGSHRLAGWSEAELVVKWELRGPGGVTAITRGSATARRHTMASIFDAFRGALRNFLANPLVAKAVRTDKAPQAVAIDRPRPTPQRALVPIAKAIQPIVSPRIVQPIGGPIAPKKPAVKAPIKHTADARWVVPKPRGIPSSMSNRLVVTSSRPAVVTVLAGDAWGSGTVVSSDGLIVTSAHLVSGDKIVSVVTSDGRQLECQIEAMHPPTNLALLRVPNASLLPLLFRLDAPPRLSEPLVALGTPYHPALSYSVSRGRVTALGKKKVGTDIRVSRGNSGGPLLDGYGRVVAIVTWSIMRRVPSSRADAIPSVDVFRALGVRYSQ
jgi:S1-C subfamily serine protease